MLLLLCSSVGFAAELSLTLLNDAVDKVGTPSSIRLVVRTFFCRALFAWMGHHLDTTIGKVTIDNKF